MRNRPKPLRRETLLTGFSKISKQPLHRSILMLGRASPSPLRSSSQADAETALKESVDALPGDATETGYVIMGKDGQVAVLIGQLDYSSRQLNFVTQTKRQPASTFKPFVYAAALEGGVVEPSDELTVALARSDNDEPRRLARLVGTGPIMELARRFGINSTLRADKSLALGTSEVSLLELTSAYVPFRNGGSAVRPYGYYGVTSGNQVRSWTSPALRREIDSKLANTMREMLRAVVVEGTGMPAKNVEDAAGKTGTSDGNRDAWFIGMNSTHVSGIWIGNPDNSRMRGVDGADAARIWARIETALPQP